MKYVFISFFLLSTTLLSAQKMVIEESGVITIDSVDFEIDFGLIFKKISQLENGVSLKSDPVLVALKQESDLSEFTKKGLVLFAEDNNIQAQGNAQSYRNAILNWYKEN